MPIPSNLDFAIRFDERNRPSAGLSAFGNRFVSDERLVIDITLEKLQPTIPPTYLPINITGWAGRWIAKADVDDADAAKKWDVAGVITDAVNGKMRFEVAKASVNFAVDYGYSEFVFTPSGTTEPVYRIVFGFALTKPGLTI